MAIFHATENEQKETETIIGSSVKVEGNFVGKGDVNVEGEVVGSLRTTKNLRIGPNAKIKADVQANAVFLAGQIRGNVKALEKIELTETAKLFGNVETKKISIAPGAHFTGKCQMDEIEGVIPEPVLPKFSNVKNRNNKLVK